jgi:transposase-like protein
MRLRTAAVRGLAGEGNRFSNLEEVTFVAEKKWQLESPEQDYTDPVTELHLAFRGQVWAPCPWCGNQNCFDTGGTFTNRFRFKCSECGSEYDSRTTLGELERDDE